MFGILAQGPARAQKPTPADTKELVAVLELGGVNASNAQLAALTEELRAQLLQSGKFRVVDRQQIDALLKEQALQQTGCTSQECAVQVGKILGVRKMVVGRVMKIEDDLWQVSAQLVDAESAETVRAVTYKHEGKFSTLMDQGMSVLAARLTGTAAAPAAIASAQPAAAPTGPQPGSPWRDPVTGMEFVWVPGGNFEMGCGSWDRDCFDSEKPAHQVAVSGFWMGKTEVTQGQWTRIMGSNLSIFKNGDTYPVETVSWEDAQQFISKLNSQSSGVRFRLPREAEWEYACRSGGKNQLYGTQSGRLSSAWANTQEAGKNATTPVASYPSNGLGLFDMSGNVFEWVEDAYQTYSSGPATDPVVDSGALRVYRGGGWYGFAQFARCSFRDNHAPSNRVIYLGFRLARTN
jgi:formylglycine-generating enzyme required for sulfatase activity